MALTAAIVITAISIGLLVIYGADAVVGGGGAGEGFLPLDAVTRGIGLGTPPIVFSIVAFFISRKEPSKGLGIMIIITGILIIIGGAIFLLSAAESESMAKSVGEGGGLIAIGGFIIALGSIKLKQS